MTALFSFNKQITNNKNNNLIKFVFYLAFVQCIMVQLNMFIEQLVCTIMILMVTLINGGNLRDYDPSKPSNDGYRLV
jgi:hypothetical protein